MRDWILAHTLFNDFGLALRLSNFMMLYCVVLGALRLYNACLVFFGEGDGCLDQSSHNLS